MNDDDILRRALRPPTEPISSSRVLQDLRPQMRRARNRRRAGVGVGAAFLILGGSAGVLALTSASISPTMRTTPSSSDNGAVTATLPSVTEPLRAPGSDIIDEPPVPTIAADPLAIDPPVAPEPDTEATGGVPKPAEPAPQPVPPAPASDPDPTITPAPPPTTQPTAVQTTTASPQPSPTTQVLSSACGDVVVEIVGRTVRISSMAPAEGYITRVSTDGPESVEMKFFGSVQSCEVHAELKPGGLDVEIQTSGNDH